MQYFHGPKTKQIFGRSWGLADIVLVAPAADAFARSCELADIVLVALAADADGAAASAPAPTIAAATTASTSILSLFIVPPPSSPSLCLRLYGRKDSDSGCSFPRRSSFTAPRLRHVAPTENAVD